MDRAEENPSRQVTPAMDEEAKQKAPVHSPCQAHIIWLLCPRSNR